LFSFGKRTIKKEDSKAQEWVEAVFVRLFHNRNANSILKLRCAKYDRTYGTITKKYKAINNQRNYAKFKKENIP
jgi:hypothetical protein